MRRSGTQQQIATNVLLTPRERKILLMIAGGCPYKRIARNIGIEYATLKNIMWIVMIKLGVRINPDCGDLYHTKNAAVMIALARGIIRLDEVPYWNHAANCFQDWSQLIVRQQHDKSRMFPMYSKLAGVE